MDGLPKERRSGRDAEIRREQIAFNVFSNAKIFTLFAYLRTSARRRKSERVPRETTDLFHAYVNIFFRFFLKQGQGS